MGDEWYAVTLEYDESFEEDEDLALTAMSELINAKLVELFGTDDVDELTSMFPGFSQETKLVTSKGDKIEDFDQLDASSWPLTIGIKVTGAKVATEVPEWNDDETF